MSDSSWTRPAEVPFPTVWRRCSGRRPLADGSVPRFRVQDVPDELHGAVMEHLTTHLLRDEPLKASLRVLDDPLAVSEIQGLWRTLLNQRSGFVVFVEGGKDGQEEIAGCNLTGVAFRADKGKKIKYESEAIKKLIAAMDYIGDMVDPFELYGVDKCMITLALSVHPRYRGQGLGLEMLKARFDLARAVGLPLTVSVFTAITSQVLAHRLGMDLLAEVPYREYRVAGQLVFPDVETVSMKLMAKRIEPTAEDDKEEERERGFSGGFPLIPGVSCPLVKKLGSRDGSHQERLIVAGNK